MKKVEELHLVILGPSGGGKGTQAELLEKRYGLAHISTGELFREEVKKKTRLGEKAQKYLRKGLFVPTPLTLEVFVPVLDKLGKRGFILEGFPRLPDQPQFLEEFLEKRDLSLDAVLDLRVRRETILKRKKAMGKKFQLGRSDDKIAILEKRLDEYEKNIVPIREFYQKRGLLIEINGEPAIEVIFQDIVSRLEELTEKNG